MHLVGMNFIEIINLQARLVLAKLARFVDSFRYPRNTRCSTFDAQGACTSSPSARAKFELVKSLGLYILYMFTSILNRPASIHDLSIVS